MKKLAIRLTSKLETEYLTSRLDKSFIAYKRFDLQSNETDSEVWIEDSDIRISGFNRGMIIFEFYTNTIQPAVISIDIKYVENFSIWAV